MYFSVSIFIFENKGIRIQAGVDIPQVPAKPRPSDIISAVILSFRSATPRLLAPAVTHPGLSDGELAPFPTLPGMNTFGIRSPVRLWRRLSLCLRQTLHLLARMGAPLLRHVAPWHRGMQLPVCLYSECHHCWLIVFNCEGGDRSRVPVSNAGTSNATRAIGRVSLWLKQCVGQDPLMEWHCGMQ
jgi:hypothetical protein